MAYDNTNSGVLFKNLDKEHDNHPDYKGSFTDKDGVEHWLSAWIKVSGPQSKNPGSKFMSLAATPKDAQRGGHTAPDAGDFDEDDIPFLDPYKFNWRVL